MKTLREALLWYGGAGVVVFVLAVVILVSHGLRGSMLAWTVVEVARQVGSEPVFWAVLVVPYGLFAWLRSPVRVTRARGWAAGAVAALWRVAMPVFVVIACVSALRMRATAEDFTYAWDHAVENTSLRSRRLHDVDGKQRGVHLFAGELGPDVIRPLVASNVEWVVHVPFVWQDHRDRPGLRVRSSSAIDTSTDRHLVAQIELTRSVGMKSILKPHVMIRDGGFRGEMAMASAADWHEWFGRYRAALLGYAALAEELGVELLCVGTELHSAVRARPRDWLDLIVAVRGVYGGELVYAANWNDPLDEIPFWGELDYIGVQAYFPLTDVRHPTVPELVAGWQPHLERLAQLSARHDRPIVFTELGYKSVPDAAVAPWEWSSLAHTYLAEVSVETQLSCYQAFFRAVWHQDWFAGVHLWKWSGDHAHAGGVDHPGFTPQNKPAQNEIARWFGRVAGSVDAREAVR